MRLSFLGPHRKAPNPKRKIKPMRSLIILSSLALFACSGAVDPVLSSSPDPIEGTEGGATTSSSGSSSGSSPSSLPDAGKEDAAPDAQASDAAPDAQDAANGNALACQTVVVGPFYGFPSYTLYGWCAGGYAYYWSPTGGTMGAPEADCSYAGPMNGYGVYICAHELCVLEYSTPSSAGMFSWVCPNDSDASPVLPPSSAGLCNSPTCTSSSCTGLEYVCQGGY